MKPWYRAYVGLVADPKLAEVAITSGASKSIVIATWHAILESASDVDEEGRFETGPRRVAAILGESIGVIEVVFTAMTEVGLIDAGNVRAWRRRQYQSDSSTQRSRDHRERKRNVAATFQQQPSNSQKTPPRRTATGPESESETESSLVQQQSHFIEEGTPEHAAWAAYRGRAPLSRFDKERRKNGWDFPSRWPPGHIEEGTGEQGMRQ